MFAPFSMLVHKSILSSLISVIAGLEVASVACCDPGSSAQRTFFFSIFDGLSGSDKSNVTKFDGKRPVSPPVSPFHQFSSLSSRTEIIWPVRNVSSLSLLLQNHTALEPS